MSMGNVSGKMPVLVCGPGRTKKQFSKGSDINNIVARFRKTGQFDAVAKTAPVFADVSQIGDFHSVIHRVRLAEESFDRLPSVVRSRFQNDAGKLVSFLQDPENREEAIKLGLIEKPLEPPVVPPTAPVVPVVPHEGASVPPEAKEVSKPTE